jgi:hypothetical protein
MSLRLRALWAQHDLSLMLIFVSHDNLMNWSTFPPTKNWEYDVV